MNKKERRILAPLCYGHFISHFNMLVFPAVVIPLTISLNMDIASVLSLSFWMYLLFGISALPWGIIADKYGSVHLLSIYYTGAGISSFCAAAGFGSPFIFAVSLAGIGLFSGVYHPVGPGIISKHIKDINMGMGINGMYGSLGLALAPVAAGIIIWLKDARTVYIVLGIMNLAGAVIMFFSPKLEKRADNLKVFSEKNKRISSFIILLISVMLIGIIYRGSTLIIPAYFELKIKGVFEWLCSFSGNISENLAATSIISLIYLIGIPAQYAGGKISKKIDLKKSYLFFHLITIPSLFLMGIATDIYLIILTVVYFFFLIGLQPIQNTLMSELSPRRFLHSAYGSQFTLVFGVGSFAVMMVGAVEKTVGIETVFPALGILAAFIAGIILLLIKQGERQLND